MDTLETYDPMTGDDSDCIRVQELLDMARNIDRTRRIPSEVRVELGHYAHYNGGTQGVFHVMHDETNIAAMVHSAWFDHSLQFNAIAVAPEYRGQGVAQRIIYTLAHAAIDLGIDDLWVYALRNSRASHVYARLGLTQPPANDERHVPHGRYFPMAASPQAVMDVAQGTKLLELRGELPRRV